MREEQKILPSFSQQELQRIISYKPKGFGQIRVHAVLLTLIDTGCRINELLTLKRDNVDFHNLLMKVMGKGRKERIISMSLELRKVLFKYLQKHEYDFVFLPEREHC
jgi:site-specific recombinase XerD